MGYIPVGLDLKRLNGGSTTVVTKRRALPKPKATGLRLGVAKTGATIKTAPGPRRRQPTPWLSGKAGGKGDRRQPAVALPSGGGKGDRRQPAVALPSGGRVKPVKTEPTAVAIPVLTWGQPKRQRDGAVTTPTGPAPTTTPTPVVPPPTTTTTMGPTTTVVPSTAAPYPGEAYPGEAYPGGGGGPYGGGGGGGGPMPGQGPMLPPDDIEPGSQEPEAPPEPWYKNKWVWLGAAAAWYFLIYKKDKKSQGSQGGGDTGGDL